MNRCLFKAVAFFKHTGGQSLVEFAFILPVMLLLLLGTVDMGLGFRTYIGLTNATREGVRWVSINPTDQTGAQARVAAEASRMGGMSADRYTVSFSPSPPYSAGENVTVRIDYTYEILFGVVTGLPDVPFSTSSTMVVLYDE